MRHSTTLVPSYPPSVDNPTLGNINLTINENLLSDHDPHVQSTTTVQNMSHMYGTPFQAKWRRHGFRTIENMVDHCNTRGVFMDFFFVESGFTVLWDQNASRELFPQSGKAVPSLFHIRTQSVKFEVLRTKPDARGRVHKILRTTKELEL